LTKIDEVTEKIEQDFDVQAAKMDKREVFFGDLLTLPLEPYTFDSVAHERRSQ